MNNLELELKQLELLEKIQNLLQTKSKPEPQT